MTKDKPLDCLNFSKLSIREYAIQKNGWPKDDSSLAEEVNQLILVKDLSVNSNRSKFLKQCPHCQTYYLYQTDYEYLANGSENERF